jgi:hypothetical protein
MMFVRGKSMKILRIAIECSTIKALYFMVVYPSDRWERSDGIGSSNCKAFLFQVQERKNGFVNPFGIISAFMV